MRIDETREQLRQVYQKEDSSEKQFIPAKPKKDIYGEDHIFRTCAYCRVSTGNDEQLSSFELQQAHYKQLVANHPNWDLKHIYSDEGISGTSLKKRESFNEMIDACRRGEYDLIVTKSVSRFARNLLDCITIVRELKAKNPPVGVFFETDNLYTLSADSEFMLTFLATFAQEESVKKSEAMNWSLNQRFRDGKLLTPALLGYDRPRDVTGKYIKYAPLEVNEREAEIVRFIFDAYLYGWNMKEIAQILTDIGCETKSGSKKWSQHSINYILTNERYCGDVLTWKTFTSDLYEHKHRKNRQDRDQYLYKEMHDAIITMDKFEAVQVLIENHKHHIRGGFPVMNVIDEGIFKGFVPINHHWMNYDAGSYYDASNSVDQQKKVYKYRKSAFSAFDFEGYQVVRSQFMSSRYEGPVLTVNREKIGFNAACMRKFAGVSHIQLLLHPTERKIAIRPCEEKDVHSIRFIPDPEKVVNSKYLSSPHFCDALFEIMEWNPEYIYKIRGTWTQRRENEIIVFNLFNAVPVFFISEQTTKEEAQQKLEELASDLDEQPNTNNEIVMEKYVDFEEINDMEDDGNRNICG